MSLRVPFVRLRVVVVMVVAAGLTSGVRGAAAIETATMVSTASESNEISTKGSAVAVVERKGASESFEAGAWSGDAVGSINPQVLKLALGASRCATSNGHVSNPGTLTIIDYSKPSTEPRMWVLDLNNRALLYEELVAHGQGSGGNMANAFSNTPDSHQTSIGLFVTDDTYVGRNGYSLRLNGLEAGFNDRARERAIVMHGAPYVNTSITKGLGRLGRSHGCPAVREPVARELIDTVKGGNLVFSYYPDAKWLETSKFLSCAN
ncbi:MAG TPA: murein L,D-transpeptidase catalytic domain family protein [Vicinamibacterales bacterium]|nr:murein L,D-transpeptidase catalytic domain family protein [Vicinamibacterales bacterium]